MNLPNNSLTEREREILRLVATGSNIKDISRHLVISSNTVKVHLQNIYKKIGVNSRTEAALYALKTGLSSDSGAHKDETGVLVTDGNGIPTMKGQRKWVPIVLVGLIIVLLVASISYMMIKNGDLKSENTNPILPSPNSVSRWREHAPMLTARSGSAIAVYENKIYAIGGSLNQSVTGVVEAYDEATDSWITRKSKPVPVADVSAAVIGGKIYIPGGRIESGSVTNILESYDPSQDHWERHASMPTSSSGYALISAEGKMYIFGGWDGQKYLETVYEYNPDTDSWLTCTPMPTARAFAAASIAGERFFVLGGYDGNEALAVNEEYLPNQDSWIQRTSLPEARYAMGIANVLDFIYIVGGEGRADSILPSLQYFSQKDSWQTIESPYPHQWSRLGMVSLGTQLFAMGGQSKGLVVAQNLSYQAIYTIMIDMNP
jgi:DNA-binding CsgD family transcriptional regulator/N-acetylneuraminic acid mutarotase